MTARFNPSDWVTVIPRQPRGLFQTPYAELAGIVSRETGSDLEECFGCGQLREHVVAVADTDGHGPLAVCGDCRRRYGL